MFFYTIIIVLPTYIFYKHKKFIIIIKELTEQNKILQANFLKTKNECHKKGPQIVEYKRKLGIKGRYFLFDSMTAK